MAILVDSFIRALDPTIPRHAPSKSNVDFFPSTSTSSSLGTPRPVGDEYRIATQYIYEFQDQVRKLTAVIIYGRDSSDKFFDWTKGGIGYISPAKCEQARNWLGVTRATWIANGSKLYFECSSEIFERGLKFLDLFDAQLAELELSATNSTRHTGFAKRNAHHRSFCLKVWKQCVSLFQEQMRQRLKYWERENKVLSEVTLTKDIFNASRRGVSMLRDNRWAGLFSETIREVRGVRIRDESEGALVKEIESRWQKGIHSFKAIQRAYEQRNRQLASVALLLPPSPHLASELIGIDDDESIAFFQPFWDFDLSNQLAPMLIELQYLARGPLTRIIGAYMKFCQNEATYLLQMEPALGFDQMCLVENAFNVIKLNAYFEKLLASFQEQLDSTLEHQAGGHSTSTTNDNYHKAQDFLVTAREHVQTVKREAHRTVAMMSAYLESRDPNVLSLTAATARHAFLEEEVFESAANAVQTARQLLQLIHHRALRLRQEDISDLESSIKRPSVCGLRNEHGVREGMLLPHHTTTNVRAVFCEVLKLLELCKRSSTIVSELHGLINVRGLPMWNDVVTGSSTMWWFERCKVLMTRVLSALLKVYPLPLFEREEVDLLLHLVDQRVPVEILRTLSSREIVRKLIQYVFAHGGVFRTLFAAKGLKR